MRTQVMMRTIFLIQCFYFGTTFCWSISNGLFSLEENNLPKYYNIEARDTIYEDDDDNTTEKSTTVTHITEEPATDADSSEKHTTIPDTTSTESNITTTDKIPDCPPGVSRHTAKDIKDIIDYVFNNENYHQSINESYSQKAQEIAKENFNNISEFRRWITHHPEHLKHVLQGLAEIRKKYIEPTTERIVDELKENPQLEEQFQNRLSIAQSLLSQLKDAEEICKIKKCLPPPKANANSRKKRSTSEEYYCSSIEDLHNEIQEKLNSSVENIKESLRNQLDNQSNIYLETIQNLTETVKMAVLNNFGRTMYDILLLQDEYQHFSEKVMELNVAGKTFSIKDMGTQIDRQLLYLQRDVNIFSEYCDSCKRAPRPQPTQSENEVPAFLSAIEFKDQLTIVDDLIKVKFDDEWNATQIDIENIFERLNNAIAETGDIEKILVNLKSLQEEIAGLTAKEKQVLTNLKLHLSESLILNLMELVKKSTNLLDEIKDTLKRNNISIIEL